jgi:hypothetical protein
MKARDCIEDALREIGVLDVEEAMDASHVRFGLRKLRRMLLSWQNLDYNVWLKAEQTVTLAAATRVYTLSPVRPLRILSARVVTSGIETPLQELTRQDYDTLPLKTSTGRPTSYHYDRQREDARFYVWPVPGAVGDTIKITYARQIEPMETFGAEVDVPEEWEDAVVYGLAVSLSSAYSRTPPIDLAAGSLNAALAFDREDSVFFT